MKEYKTPLRKRLNAKRYKDKKNKSPKWRKKMSVYMHKYRQDNKDHMNELNRKHYEKNSTKINLRRKGLSLDLVVEIKNHSGLCDICGSPGDGRWKKLNIDHCHEKLVFRGMLCTNCNRGIGWFKENPELIKKAYHYLIGGKI